MSSGFEQDLGAGPGHENQPRPQALRRRGERLGRVPPGQVQRRRARRAGTCVVSATWSPGRGLTATHARRAQAADVGRPHQQVAGRVATTVPPPSSTSSVQVGRALQAGRVRAALAIRRGRGPLPAGELNALAPSDRPQCDQIHLGGRDRRVGRPCRMAATARARRSRWGPWSPPRRLRTTHSSRTSLISGDRSSTVRRGRAAVDRPQQDRPDPGRHRLRRRLTGPIQAGVR